MILRKPYAFLIRNFRKINVLLLIAAIYIFWQSMSLSNLTGKYMGYGDSGVLEEILGVFSSFYFYVIIFSLILTGILLFLLYRKEKPVKTYVFTFVVYVALLIFGMYANNYFSGISTGITNFDKAISRNMNGISFLLTLPQYGILLLLLIRAIGLDLKSFGFRQDKELYASEEDREEVEIEAQFNYDKWKRNFKKFFREVGYVVKQYKLYIIIACVVLLLFGGYSTYHYFYVTNRVYNMNETVSSNYYDFNIKNSYITTRDYKGDKLAQGKSFVIIDVDVTNLHQSTRNLDIDKFMLFVDDRYYTPTINYNEYFSDLGPVFKRQPLKGHEKANYFIIFEIDTPKKDSSFLLRYQDLVSKSKLLKIKLKIKDISEFVERDTKRLGEELDIKVNIQESISFKASTYELGDRYSYTYESCYVNNCPVYEGEIVAKNGRKILFIKPNILTITKRELLNFATKYGKIEYVIGGKTYQEDLRGSISREYKGNYLYFDVSERVSNADSLQLVFTIRNNRYRYILK